jgi:hypothetical protein
MGGGGRRVGVKDPADDDVKRLAQYYGRTLISLRIHRFVFIKKNNNLGAAGSFTPTLRPPPPIANMIEYQSIIYWSFDSSFTRRAI